MVSEKILNSLEEHPVSASLEDEVEVAFHIVEVDPEMWIYRYHTGYARSMLISGELRFDHSGKG